MCHKVALLELFHFEAVGAVLSKRVSSLFKILGVVFTPFFFTVPRGESAREAR